MSAALVEGTAEAIAAAVRSGAVSAREIAQETLNRIEARNGALGAFTEVTATRALAKADAIDTARVRGENLGPLAGAPFAVKNLFDVEGLTTRAGSKINRDHPPAKADATMITRLEAAGGVLVGALNMGEYAYDFTGRNVHDGPSRNPHDLEHMTGGSSGGSAAAVAGGLVPIALGSDTNGSIRVPSSFCGLFGLKPTYGRLSRTGTFPFVASLDHVGPLARSAGDLALSYDLMLGRDGGDQAQADRPAPAASPTLNDGIAGLRIATLGGYFARSADPSAIAAVDTIAARLESGPCRRTRRGRSRPFRGLSHHDGRGSRASSWSVVRTGSRLRPGSSRSAYRRRDGSWRLGRAGAKIPPSVSCGDARALSRRRCTARTSDSLPRSQARADDLRARWSRDAGATEYRALHPADLLHRAAGGRGAGMDRGRKASDWRPDHCCPLA